MVICCSCHVNVCLLKAWIVRKSETLPTSLCKAGASESCKVTLCEDEIPGERESLKSSVQLRGEWRTISHPWGALRTLFICLKLENITILYNRKKTSMVGPASLSNQYCSHRCLMR